MVATRYRRHGHSRRDGFRRCRCRLHPKTKPHGRTKHAAAVFVGSCSGPTSERAATRCSRPTPPVPNPPRPSRQSSSRAPSPPASASGSATSPPRGASQRRNRACVVFPNRMQSIAAARNLAKARWGPPPRAIAARMRCFPPRPNRTPCTVETHQTQMRAPP